MMTLDQDLYYNEKALSKLTEKISSMDGVTEVHQVKTGIYDMIVKIKGDDAEKLKSVVESKIKRIDGVRSTMTHLILDAYNP